MADPEGCLQDGFSTAASPGLGLGTIRRQSDRFDLYTMPNEGTVMVATVAASSTGASQPSGEARFDSAVAGLSVPVKGETQYGDAWAAIDQGNRLDLLTCDGLGHGAKAAAILDNVVPLIYKRWEEREGEFLNGAGRNRQSGLSNRRR